MKKVVIAALLSFATTVAAGDASINTNLEELSLEATRIARGPTCDWGECMDNCYAQRNRCFDRNNPASVCDPEYDSCKGWCNNACR